MKINVLSVQVIFYVKKEGVFQLKGNVAFLAVGLILFWGGFFVFHF